MGQRLWRHVQSIGLQNRYINDELFRLNVNKLITLAFVPPDNVVKADSSLIIDFDQEADGLLTYSKTSLLLGSTTLLRGFRSTARTRESIFSTEEKRNGRRTRESTNEKEESWKRLPDRGSECPSRDVRMDAPNTLLLNTPRKWTPRWSEGSREPPTEFCLIHTPPIWSPLYSESERVFHVPTVWLNLSNVNSDRWRQ